MPKQSKDCVICVYNGACEGRIKDPTIRDCCIPEAPLRRLQLNARTAEHYADVTHNYIRTCKNESDYWRVHAPKTSE